MEAKNPFAGHEKFYFELPVSDRTAHLKSMINTPQSDQIFNLDMPEYPKQFKYNFQGTQYQIYAWEPKSPPRAILVIFHGMDGYVGRSGHIARFMAENAGVAVVGYDYRNFGKSGGDIRGYIHSFQEILETSEKMVEYLRSLYSPGLKVFLSGLSMGGLVAFRLSILKPEKYAGIVFMAPALRENKEVMPLMKKLGKCVGWLFPWLSMNPGEANNGNRFKNQSVIYRADPHNFTASLIPSKVRIILNAMAEAEIMYDKLQTPYLMIQGGVDKLVDPFLAVDLHRESASKDKTTIMCKDMWHAVWVEAEIIPLMPIMADWISKRI